MTKTILFSALSLVTVTGFAQVKKPATTAKPAAKPVTPAVNLFKNNNDSISYAVGLRIGQSLKGQGFDNINMTLFTKAMSDLKQNKPALLTDAAITECISKFQVKANENMQKQNEAKAAGAKKEGQAFLATNGKRPGVITLPSGLQYEVMKAGTDNTKPTAASKVKCHYHGTLINGTIFDSSVDRGTPIEFEVGNVIRGWQEALQLMTVGSKWKLWIPSDLAYGDNPRPGGAIQPGDMLIFEVELLGIVN
jgi:FKBP-type peptidyl-prolyl cis-trans isomerase FklB